MKCYEVTGVVAAEKQLSALDELSLIALRSPEGERLVAADPAGGASWRPGGGEHLWGTGGAGSQSAGGCAGALCGQPVSGLSPLLNRLRAEGSDRSPGPG